MERLVTPEALRAALDALAARDERIAAALVAGGYPEPRVRPRGYVTLLRTIIGQQVSVRAADSIWTKLEGAVGEIGAPAAMLALGEGDLRAAGLSRQKQTYCRSLADASATGALDFDALPEEDEAAIYALTRVKGVGRWSAEIYLLFAEGRPDIWPAGDLVVQIVAGRLAGLPEKPGERETRAIAEDWRPYRGAAAVLMWRLYNTAVI